MSADGKALVAAAPLFPLKNPGIVSIPLEFLAAWLGSLLSRPAPDAAAAFDELTVRTHAGIGAE